ncbi:hypothetical protein CP985_14205 [Malaciobacter mytili LMG 24559]|uniref:DUF4178 domain-containing protein n=1 Tax=Malaciobacter mytili LMG 24559 TaxID=1032238 RepID=A0AAX2AD48_9BACT|nr:hypothetical protein [Malaciobacter mytili]AXH16336.1 hypothetical protein AMYT_a0036 [Malaciobacter mytili LMG 24559]RXK12866.1 hypothetical protein CP985_14205 [Malaciobacter mytili LMG 24559]
MENYKVGQKVRIVTLDEVDGVSSSDIILKHLGEVVTIKTVTDDCGLTIYTVEEIDGVDFIDVDFSGHYHNLQKWQEETICPCCGSKNFSNYEDYQSEEIFRIYTCDDCDESWTERYNLTKISSFGNELEIPSEKENRLEKENQVLRSTINKLRIEPKFCIIDENDVIVNCNIKDYPIGNVEYKKLDFVNEDPRVDYPYGIEFNKYNYNGELLENIDIVWFSTEAERLNHILKEDLISYCKDINQDDLKHNLRLYEEDSLFIIENEIGEISITLKYKLWQAIQVSDFIYYIRFEKLDSGEILFHKRIFLNEKDNFITTRTLSNNELFVPIAQL